ncbi:MAG TPA: aldehyde dehydrogenase family protein, partial [Candidatus Izemoplasmatales bacterium]|nr:aldehyde dehydrogenase family protein [Candidatus Izemoplasmatales bacterium]
MAIYEYRTEPLTDFSKEENRKKYEEALKKVGSELGGNYPLVIGGRQIYTKNVYTSVNPANHSQKIGTICQAGIKEADEAMEAALKAFETWKKTDAKVRAGILFKLAAIMKRERFEFNAIMTLEAGKPWIEADADTAEAIDFLEYYGRQMLSLERIDDAVLSRRDIEKNEYRYIPLGVGAIITPWNF